MAPIPEGSAESSGESSVPKTFSFVEHGNVQGESRSHAMREHWKQRRQRMKEEKQRVLTRPQHILLPALATGSGESSHSRVSALNPEGSSSSALITSESSESETMLNDELAARMDGIPNQMISGMNVALGSTRLDPFDRFPIKLTSQHHKLLHHWLSTFSVMFFEEPNDRVFNPMRDVWLPLDLSNAASFNAIMAHSAAHLSRMQGFTHSREALRFKSEAVQIVQLWMNDSQLTLTDDLLAAVLRLLTFERYWGTEAEWSVHRNGLLNLIEARGGIETLRSNWRLELTTYLVSLMGRPTWFDCSNQIMELSTQTFAPSLHPILGDEGNLHRLRCLWLLSFVQDMGTFRTNSARVNLYGMTQYSALREVFVLLKSHRQGHDVDLDRSELCSNAEFTRLACLLFICVLLQQATAGSKYTQTSTQEVGSTSYDAGVVNSFNSFLEDNKSSWLGSVDHLYNTLFNNVVTAGGAEPQTEYIKHMTGIMASMDGEVRHAVERCLLGILCQVNTQDENIFVEEWSPDALLSLISGQ